MFAGVSARVRRAKVRRVQAQQPSGGKGEAAYDDYDYGPEEYYDEYDEKKNGESFIYPLVLG